jgi:hypothetical protein
VRRHGCALGGVAQCSHRPARSKAATLAVLRPCKLQWQTSADKNVCPTHGLCNSAGQSFGSCDEKALLEGLRGVSRGRPKPDLKPFPNSIRHIPQARFLHYRNSPFRNTQSAGCPSSWLLGILKILSCVCSDLNDVCLSRASRTFVRLTT